MSAMADNQSRMHARARGESAPVRGLLPLGLALLLWEMLASPNSPYFPPPLQWFRALEALSKEIGRAHV